MSRKTKINVLLPIKMVGELESRARNNSRSKFIQSAIRSKLDDEDAFSPSDIPTKKLFGLLHHRLDGNQLHQDLLLIIKEMVEE